MNKYKKYLEIFLLFFKIGLFTFGGGYAMIALIEREIIDKRGWLTHEEFIDIVAIAESTPGPIAINSATYIGYKIGKFLGSFLATIAVCIPSFIIIYVISLFFDSFLHLKYVGYAFKGIQVCVSYLIISAGFKMLKKMKRSYFYISLLIITILLMTTFTIMAVNISSIYLILTGAMTGIIVYNIQKLKKKDDKGGYEE